MDVEARGGESQRATRRGAARRGATHGIDRAFEDILELAQLLRLAFGSLDTRRATAGGDQGKACLLVQALFDSTGELVARMLCFRNVLSDLCLCSAKLRLCFGARRVCNDFRRPVLVAHCVARLEGPLHFAELCNMRLELRLKGGAIRDGGRER